MTQDIRFQRHELEWTPEKIARFWDYESQNEAKRDEYFTFQVGDALIRLARQSGALEEPVLDYGAGVGYLTERLVEQGVRCAACDFSPASVQSINQRMAGKPSFEKCEWLQGLPSSLPSDAYGTVFLAETLEHLLPEWRRNTLQEIWRVLKPGGHAFITVPHAESLEASRVLCADCGAVFHRVQHVAAFDEKSLSAEMGKNGFTEVLCRPMSLTTLTDPMQRRDRRFRRWLRDFLIRGHVLAPRRERPPNLVYIGKKG